MAISKIPLPRDEDISLRADYPRRSRAQAETPERFVDLKTACDFLQVKQSFVYEMTHRKAIPHYKYGKFLRFRLSELAAWAEDRREGPNG